MFEAFGSIETTKDQLRNPKLSSCAFHRGDLSAVLFLRDFGGWESHRRGAHNRVATVCFQIALLKIDDKIDDNMNDDVNLMSIFEIFVCIDVKSMEKNICMVGVSMG